VKKIRIYQSGEFTEGMSVTLSEEAGQHVGVVLRMHVGEQLCLFNGTNQEFTSTITAINKKKVLVTIDSSAQVNRESPLHIHLAQAISKGERMEFVIQKAVELGVNTITPLISERCVVKLDAARIQKKVQQWQAIAVAACEQSGRNVVPLIAQPLSLEHYLNQCKAFIKLILHPYQAQPLKSFKIEESIALLIGPEGGFSEEEVLQAQALHFQPVSLGPRILRTETATITALSVLQALGGDL